MSQHSVETPATDSQLRRRNRDDRMRRETAAPASSAVSTLASLACPPQTAGRVSPALPDSAEDMLARGHAWLRFPKALEAQFRLDTLEPRRRLLSACALIGIVGLYVGSAYDARLLPDIADLYARIVRFCLAAAILSLGMMWFMPPRWRRYWHAEALTFGNVVALSAAIIWTTTVSQVDTAFTHSAAVIGPVMYACIAARQRFVWAFGSAAVALVGYVLFVHGQTPGQQLIVVGNLKLMSLSFAFALVANYALEHRERRNWLLRKLEEQQRGELLETSERLRHLSIRDPLTGLLNRRQFDADLGLAWAKAVATRQPVALLMVDVDFFKRYNDTYGHPAGDACLMQVAQELSFLAEAHGGTAARLGGEEFGLLLPGAAQSEAVHVANALCGRVRAAQIRHETSSVAGHITVSVGVALASAADGSAVHLLTTTADRALYQAKATGRDQAVVLDLTVEAAHAAAASDARDTVDATGAFQKGASGAPAAGAAASEAAYVQTLNGRFRWLRFPADQEAAYRRHNTDQRRRHLAVMTVLGLVIYNVYILCSRELFPDIHDSVLLMQFGLSLGMLALTGVGHVLPLPPLWREGLFSLGVSVIAVVSCWILSHSRHLSALNYAVSLVLIPMFSGVGARQPFWFTCVPAVITLVAASVLMNPVGPVQRLVFADVFFMIANTTVYTLILAYTLEYGARKAWLFARIEQLQREALTRATQRLHELSMLDPLTGICNRRQFEDDFRRIWAESLHDQRPLAMLIVDVDFFKLYNDGYGHPVGDRCLKQVAAAVSQTAQSAKGLTARLGGEEFGVLLPGADAPQALRLGESICAAVRQTGIEHRHSRVADCITVSVGVASLVPARGQSRRTLFAAADDALYQAKSAGRNRVRAFGEPVTPPQPCVAVV